MARNIVRLIRRNIRRLWWLPIAAIGAGAALPAYAFFVPLAPLERQAVAPGTIVVDACGAVMYRDVEFGLRIPVSLDDIAPIMVEATIAAEDGRFAAHPGIDPLAVARAAWQWRTNPSGASTITQQLARRLYLSGQSQPLLLRKAREALIAVQLEARYSKDELLTAYLNDIYYGRGAYGIEAAARIYFGVSAKHLDLARASFLAGLPQLPSVFDSSDELSGADARQRYVLGRLAARNVITNAQSEMAAATALQLAPPDVDLVAPHFVRYVFDELERVRPDLAGRPGLRIETTLDPDLQREAERAVQTRLAALTEGGTSNAAVVVLDPGTGRLLAMVGSADFGAEAGQINMALAPRQPGSALKPFLYVAAFERGYTPQTQLLDVPTTFETASGPYTPHNYNLQFQGPTPLRVALASSLNVPAVRTLDDIGVDALIEMAHRTGMTSLGAAPGLGLALTLGAGEVPLLDLTAAYGVLAAGGQFVAPVAILRVRDGSGHVLYEAPSPEPAQVIAPEHAFLIADILSDPLARLPAFGQLSPLETAVGAAVKTGTSSFFRDNWTVGFTPDRVVGVWTGNSDGSSMTNVSGVDGSGPIWNDVIEAATTGRPRLRFDAPPGMERASVCSPTGLLPGPDCPSIVEDWFVAGTVPVEVERYYERDAGGALMIAPPVEARSWASAAGWRLVPGGGAAAAGGAAPAVLITQPRNGTVLFMAPELGASEVMLRAAVPAGTTLVEFSVDGKHVANATGDDAAALWMLDEGAHELVVVAHLSDGSTTTARSTYEVRAP